MSLNPFQHSRSQIPQVSLYSRNSYSEDYDPTFDPNFDEDDVFDGLSPPRIICLPADQTRHVESPYPEVRSAVANFDDPEMPGAFVELYHPARTTYQITKWIPFERGLSGCFGPCCYLASTNFSFSDTQRLLWEGYVS